MTISGSIRGVSQKELRSLWATADKYYQCFEDARMYTTRKGNHADNRAYRVIIPNGNERIVERKESSDTISYFLKKSAEGDIQLCALGINNHDSDFYEIALGLYNSYMAMPRWKKRLDRVFRRIRKPAFPDVYKALRLHNITNSEIPTVTDDLNSIAASKT